MENPVPRVNQKGLVTRDLQKKEAYYVFQSYWTDHPMVHIYGHSWPVRWGAAGEKKMVKVYSNCETAELFVNGVSAGVRTRNSQDFPAAGLRWVVPFVEGTNKLRVVARRDSATVNDDLEFVYQTQVWGAPATFKLTELRREPEKVTLEARLYDAQGVLCLDARNRVRFTISGNGALIDNLGTPTGSRVVELCNGRTEISLTHQTGDQTTVGISSKGLPTAFCAVA